MRSYQGELLHVIAGESEAPGEPSGASAQNKSGSTGMRDHAGREDQRGLLRSYVNRSQQAASGKASTARLGINRNLAHEREVNNHAIAGAEAGKTVSSATDGGNNSGLGGGADGGLHVVYICAAHDQLWRALRHAIPDGARFFVTAVAGAQQVTFKLRAKRG